MQGADSPGLSFSGAPGGEGVPGDWGVRDTETLGTFPLQPPPSTSCPIRVAPPPPRSPWTVGHARGTSQPASPLASPDTRLSLITHLSPGPPRHLPSSQWERLQGPQTSGPSEAPQAAQGPGLIPRQTLSTTCHCLKFHHSQGPPRLQDKRAPPSPSRADTWVRASHAQAQAHGPTHVHTDTRDGPDSTRGGRCPREEQHRSLLGLRLSQWHRGGTAGGWFNTPDSRRSPLQWQRTRPPDSAGPPSPHPPEETMLGGTYWVAGTPPSVLRSGGTGPSDRQMGRKCGPVGRPVSSEGDEAAPVQRPRLEPALS